MTAVQREHSIRIQILGLNFSPELAGIGKYTGELASFLARQGYEVRVVAAPPYYPQWRVAEGYTPWRYQREEWEGMQVTRCPLWVPRTPSGFKRVLHLLSFAISSLPAMLAQARWKPDLVIAIAPAILSAPNAWLLARLTGAKSWLHIQDFELEAAQRLGIVAGLGRLMGVARKMERALISRFNRVSTISQTMIERLKSLDVPQERLFLLPNWVDTDQIRPFLPDRGQFDLPQSATMVLYAGSMGQKQGLEVMVEAARLLQADRDVLFVIAGNGASRTHIECSTRSLPNVRLLPLQPADRYSALLAAADIHVLSERPGATGLVMPSKLGPMLASGRPVVASVDLASEVAHIVRNVGLVASPADPHDLSLQIRRLAESRAMRERLGANGRAYAEKHWSKEVVLPRFAAQVSSLCRSR